MSSVTEEADLEKAVQEYSIFGRVSPLQKKQIVQSLQKHGHSVAMTGDGVNDLLALREADCSIAIAEGSDAARQVSQVVLLNSDFSSLPSVLSEGRRVVNNITRVAGIFFVKTIYSVLLSIVCLLLNIPFPFVPIQITLIDLVIEGYPSFFMSFEPDSRKVSGRFLPSVMARALPNAISILVCFLVFLGVSPLLQISAEQSSNTPLFVSRNRWNPGGIQGELALEQAAGVPLLHHDGWILCSGFPVPQTSPGLPSHHRDLTPVCRFCPAQLLD